jgi:hypothetical protein
MNFYVYVIRFVDGHYYYGYHPTYGNNPQLDNYYGTPITHKEKWLDTMFWKEVLGLYETFKEANAAEQALIRPCYKTDPFCLNENCGGAVSPEQCRVGGNVSGKKHALNKTGVCGRVPEKIKEDGRKGGSIAGPLNVKNRKGIHSSEWGLKRSEAAKETARSNVDNKIGIFSEEWLNSEECRKHYKENGRIAAERGIGIHTFESRSNAGTLGSAVTNSQKWVDLDHPELGEHSAPTLAQMQKRRGYPSGKENRVKVG